MEPKSCGQFVLDDEWAFGTRETGIIATGLTGPGQISYRDQDTFNPVGHDVMFGRDYLEPQPWTIDLRSVGTNKASVTDRVAWMHARWNARRQHYDTPQAESTLVWQVHNRQRRTYGRCRALEWDQGALFGSAKSAGTATFQPSTPFMYDEEKSSVRLTITPPLSGGLVFPVEFPWGSLTGGTLQGVLSYQDGQVPTDDVEIVVHGPIVDPVVEGPGWRLAFRGLSLAYDRYVTINARKRTVTRDDGASLAGRLDRRSSVRDIRIPRGDSTVKFTGVDPTGTGYAEISWRPAYFSI